jgi:hypothetical protein
MAADLVTRPISANPPGTSFSRFLMALAAGRGYSSTAMQYAAGWKDTPQVAHALELSTKAATLPGSMSDATWAAPLAAAGISQEVLPLLRGMSVVGACERSMRKVPFNVRFNRDITTAAIGNWIPEGTPTPFTAASFDAIGPLLPTKLGTAWAETVELLRVGGRAGELAIRQAVLSNVAKTIDVAFLDPASVAATGKPGSITSTGVAITSTGSTAAAMATDLAAMVAAITTSGAGLTWVMPPKTAMHLSAALGKENSGLPELLHTRPVIISANSPQQITLADLSEILYADDGVFDVDVSTQASAQMNSTPDNPATAATVMTSLWALDQVGVRAVRWLNWLVARTVSVSYMLVTY